MSFERSIKIFDTVALVSKTTLSGALSSDFKVITGSRSVFTFVVTAITGSPIINFQVKNGFTVGEPLEEIISEDLDSVSSLKKVVSDFHSLFTITVTVTGGTADVIVGVSVFDNAIPSSVVEEFLIGHVVVTTPKRMEKRIDSSNPFAVIYGETSVLGASQTDPVWRVWRVAIFGQQSHEAFGDDDDGEIHQWSQRLTYFPPVPFVNQFALNLRGATNQYGQVAHSADIDFSQNDAFTFGIWLKTASGAQTLMEKTVSARGYVFELLSTGAMRLEFRGASTSDRIFVVTGAIAAMDDNQWHLLMVSKAAANDAAQCKFWFDGAPVAFTVTTNGLVSSPENAGPLNIGANATGASRVTGFIDEGAIWNAQLSDAEVLEIYNSNAGVIDLSLGSGQISSALVSHWRMGDGMTAFPAIPDAAGANTMTLRSAVTSGDIVTEVPP